MRDQFATEVRRVRRIVRQADRMAAARVADNATIDRKREEVFQELQHADYRRAQDRPEHVASLQPAATTTTDEIVRTSEEAIRQAVEAAGIAAADPVMADIRTANSSVRMERFSPR